MEKKYREVNESDIGQEIEGSDGEKTLWSDWYKVTLKYIAEPDNDGRKFLGIHSGRWVGFRHARAELPPSYLELHQASGLKVGDWVKITKVAESREKGWNALWNNKMSTFIGSIVQITTDLGEHGFKIGGAGEWNYPCFVLEKAYRRPATEADEHLEVQWASDPDGKYWLASVFQPRGDSYPRAVLEPMPGGNCKETGYQFAFLSSVFVPLLSAPEPEPPAEPAPEYEPEAAPDPGPGYRLVDPAVDDPSTTKAEMYRGNGQLGRMYSAGWNDGIWYRCPAPQPTPAPEPVAEPEPQAIREAGSERPEWLPPGARILVDDEVIQKGDRYRLNHGAIDSHAVASIGKTVKDAVERRGHIEHYYRPADQSEPDPTALRPAWLPEEFKEVPAWLPAGYRFMALHEVIKPGDKWQDENNQDLFHNAVESIGGTVEDSWYPRRYWITPISEGQAHG